VRKSGSNLAELDFPSLHALRIEIKKLRYAAEFFSSLYDRKDLREYLSALAELQELLGHLNDGATVERLLDILRDSDSPGEQLEAVGVLRGWTAAMTRARLEQLPEAWKRFRDCRAFWKNGKGEER
jgi:CHAD domain-containing protein